MLAQTQKTNNNRDLGEKRETRNTVYINRVTFEAPECLTTIA